MEQSDSQVAQSFHPRCNTYTEFYFTRVAT